MSSVVKGDFWMVAVLAACPLLCQDRPALPGDEILARAIQSNQNLLATQQQIEEASGLLRQAGVKNPFALETGGYSGRPVGTIGEEQFSAGISRVIETGGKRPKRIQIGEKQVELARAEYAEQVRRLRYSIRAGVIEVAAQTGRLKVFDELLEVSTASLELVRARVERGDAAPLDRDLAVVERSRLEAQRALIAGRLSASRAELERLAGTGVIEPIPAVDTLALPSWASGREELIAKALRSRPDLIALGLAEEHGQRLVLLAQAMQKPDVKVSATYSYVNSQLDGQFGFDRAGRLTQLRDRDSVLAVGISVPLLPSKYNAGNIEAATARARGTQLRKTHLERSIPLEIDAALAHRDSAVRSLETLRDQVVPQGEKNLDVVRQAYQLGQLRLLDVLVEQRRLVEARLELVAARAEALSGWAELEFALGGGLP